MKSSAALSLAARTSLASVGGGGKGELLLVGTQTRGDSKGIYAYAFDEATGELKQTGLAAALPNPTFMAFAPGGNRLFAVSEVEHFAGKNGGGVTGLTLDRSNASLKAINGVATGGGGTCHVAVDHTGKCVFVANYTGGSAASFRVSDDGQLSEAVSFFQYTGHSVNPKRQQQPHAHRVTVSPDNRFLMVNDLGLDEIHIYKLDAKTAVLTPNDPPAWKSAAGAGPRALRFHPNGKWAYCVTEMTSTVDVLRWDASRGTLELVQTVELLPEGYKGETGGCDIVFDRKGRFAYVANRIDDFMASLTVSETDGKLTMLARSSCGGKTPRHLALSPNERWLLIANQDSDNIAVFARDVKTGKLAESGKSFPLAHPQCLVFA
ncbi:MAG: lactonase family protein [Edaphobacter sp.]